MLKEVVFTALGASVLLKEKVEKELETLEKKGKIKKSDAKEFIKSLEKKGKKEDARIKKELKSLIKQVINELDLVTKEDLKKYSKK